MKPEEVSDRMVRAALCGWANVPLTHALSATQELPETWAAWRRAIAAAFTEDELRKSYLQHHGHGHHEKSEEEKFWEGDQWTPEQMAEFKRLRKTTGDY